MSKHQHVQAARKQRRIFPNDYTRNDLVRYATKLGAENFDQAGQIEALEQRVRELEAQLGASATASSRAMRVHAPESRGTFRLSASLAPFARRR